MFAILGFNAVAVTQVAYEIDGWGMGELVVSDGLVVWHESPWPRRTPLVLSQTPAHPGLGRGVSRKPSPQPNSFVAEVIARKLHLLFGRNVIGSFNR